MAGNYPDVPSWRFAYDRDGSQGYIISPDLLTITQLDAGSMRALNDESNGSIVGMQGQGSYIMIWFPELRDLDGYFWNEYSQVYGTMNMSVEISANTTNGVDGTWTQIKAPQASPGALLPGYRSSIVSQTNLGIRAVRFKANQATGGHGMTTIHLYGEPIPGANPNRLAVWQPATNARTPPAYFDWGNTARSSSADKTFRIKNLSSTLTANSIRVAQEILTDASSPNPSVVGQHTISMDGGTTFLPQVNIGNLAPGAISGVLIVRRNTPSNAQLGPWALRLFAEANSWS